MLKGDRHAVVVGVTLAAVLADVCEIGIRAPEIYRILCRRQRRHVEVALHDDVVAARMQVADRYGYSAGDFAVHLKVTLKRRTGSYVRVNRGKAQENARR